MHKDITSGRSAVWYAHLNGVQVVGGSNPLAPTINDTNEQLLLYCRFE